MSIFKLTMKLNGYKTDVERSNLPIEINFNEKNYVIKATKKNKLIMTKDEDYGERETITIDPREEN